MNNSIDRLIKKIKKEIFYFIEFFILLKVCHDLSKEINKTTFGNKNSDAKVIIAIIVLVLFIIWVTYSFSIFKGWMQL